MNNLLYEYEALDSGGSITINYLADESGNFITDELGNKIIVSVG
jgi:hypothetical protein